MFVDDAADIVDGAEALLAATDRDVRDAVALRNVEDRVAASLRQALRSQGIIPGDSK
ncbi:MAG TPA: hypothetical protein VLI05_06750 [Candidatus Saccharimonadia bacterium]|nr:hypothetical protein [Candidatus Saccharimonadia bacterium]